MLGRISFEDLSEAQNMQGYLIEKAKDQYVPASDGNYGGRLSKVLGIYKITEEKIE